MTKWLGLLLLVSSSANAATGADSPLEAFVRLETSVVDLLVDADFAEYDRLRRDSLDASRRADTTEARLDEALASLDETPSLVAVAEVQRLEGELAEALERRAALDRQLEDVRHRIVDQLRRSVALREALAAVAESSVTPDLAADPVSGVWQVTLTPSGLTGRFDLTLQGTLVNGTYRLDGGQRGSLRGTYVGDRLKLERIDSAQGFDMIFEVRLGPDSERIAGSWRATLLSSSGPAGGSWSAVRARREAQ